MVVGHPVTRLLPHETKRFSREYELCAMVGKGSFGEVWVCRDRRTGERVATKLIDKASLRTFHQREEARREVAILEAFRGRHDGVVQLREVLEGESLVQIVMELCQGGDLFELLREKGALPEAAAKFLFRQLASALAYCHENGVLHRDIKPENVLLDSPHAADDLYTYRSPRDKEPCVKAKLADFGLAVVLGPGGTTTGYTGSRYYTAPEMVRGWSYGRGADVWSMGVVLCAMLTGRLPFSGQDKQDLAGLRQAILRGKVHYGQHSWTGVSETAKDLVRRMLTVDPYSRITAQEILNHPWLAPDAAPAAVLRSKPQGEASLSLPASPLNPHRSLRCQRPFGSAGQEMMSEFKLCSGPGEEEEEDGEEEEGEKGEKGRREAQAPAELAMGVPAPGQGVTEEGCDRGQAGAGAGEGQRGVLVEQDSSHHPMGMCCVGPAALADFSATGVWCFPTLMATAWLDRGEDRTQGGGCEERRNHSSGKDEVHEAPVPTSPLRTLHKARAGSPFRLGEPHMCIAPREEFYVR